MTYGYCDILDDGTLVISPWQKANLIIHENTLKTEEWLLFIRAVLHPNGNVYVVGKGSFTDRCYLYRDDGKYVPLDITYGNYCQVITVSLNGNILLTVQTGPGAITQYLVDPTFLTVSNLGSHDIPKTSQGLLNMYPDGSYELTDPVDRTMEGVHVRYPSTFNRVTIAQGFTATNKEGWPIVLKNGKSQFLGKSIAYEPHQSPNGKYWAARSADPIMLQGVIPNEIVTEPEPIPEPEPEPPVTPDPEPIPEPEPIPDPKPEPPKEPEMNPIPQSSYPFINGVRTLVTGPIDKDFGYTEYNEAVQVVKDASQLRDDYMVGFLIGYKTLFSGLKADVNILIAGSDIQQARKDKGASLGYGIGAMDMWRLIVEEGLDVQKVISRI